MYRCKLLSDGEIMVKGADTVKAQDIGSDTFKVDDKNSLLIFRAN